jgi:methyl-accepting chemotaxis protein
MGNCWELLNCGRESGCPAYPNHGRECFAVTGTTCRGIQQGTYEDKIQKCRDTCSFYANLMCGGRNDLWN